MFYSHRIRSFSNNFKTWGEYIYIYSVTDDQATVTFGDKMKIKQATVVYAF